MRIFLDDVRNPKTEEFDTVCRSYKDFWRLLSHVTLHDEKIEYISFDHDLGWDDEGYNVDGYECAKLLVELDQEYSILADNFHFNVHSANPVGAKNINTYLVNYLEMKEI